MLFFLLYGVGQFSHGLNWFFLSSMYGSSCLIEAYGSPGKYCSVYVWVLTPSGRCKLHFLKWWLTGSGGMSGRFCRCIPPLAGPIQQQWTDVGVARLAFGVAWTFTCKTLHIEKSSRFKSCEYGSQSASVQNSTKKCWVILGVLTCNKSAGRCTFH